MTEIIRWVFLLLLYVKYRWFFCDFSAFTFYYYFMLSTGDFSASRAGTAYPSGAPESTPVFSGVRVTRSLVYCVVFCRSLFSFCPFSFGYCIICPASIYGFWLALWYLQALLMAVKTSPICRIRIQLLFTELTEWSNVNHCK